MPLKYYDTRKTDYVCVSEFQNAEEENNKNWLELPVDHQVFTKFHYENSVGCQHYIRGCQVKCNKCGQFYPCRLCHDDEVFDHKFPRYETKEVKCNYCGKEQPLAQYCCQCGVCFGCYYCEKCKLLCDMGPEAKPNFHCEKCGICLVGIKDQN